MKIRQNTLKRLFAIENNNPSGKWKGKEKDMVLSVFLISIKQKYRIQNVVVQSFQDIKRYWSSLETISKALFVTIIISTISCKERTKLGTPYSTPRGLEENNRVL